MAAFTQRLYIVIVHDQNRRLYERYLVPGDHLEDAVNIFNSKFPMKKAMIVETRELQGTDNTDENTVILIESRDLGRENAAKRTKAFIPQVDTR